MKNRRIWLNFFNLGDPVSKTGKRFKDDVKEVSSGYECGLNISNFNDIKVGDIVEAYHEVEVKQKL